MSTPHLDTTAALEGRPAALAGASHGAAPLCEPHRKPATGWGTAPLWPTGPNQMCTVLDSDGHTLVRATVHLNDDRTAIVIDKAAEPGVLLTYYFLKGGRRVQARLGPSRHTGSLSTRWDRARRVWCIHLDDSVVNDAVCEERDEGTELHAQGTGQ